MTGSTPDTKWQHKYAKILAGITELDLWLQDLIRQGLVSLPTDSTALWTAIAARMMDAQAPEIARQLRLMVNVPHSDTPWHNQILTQVGQLYLLVEGWQRFKTLSPGIQADLCTQIGWTQDRRELLTQDGMIDHWWVLAQRIEKVPGITNLKAQRLWLWGEAIDRPALILNYAYGNTPFNFSLVPGQCLQAELVFYNSAYPLRAIAKTERPESETINRLPGYERITEALQAYSSALGQNPWLDRFPMGLSACIPQKRGEVLVDRDGYGLPISPDFTQNWQLMAIGGSEISVFGEWNGEFLLPLSAIAHNRFIAFGTVSQHN